MMAAAPKFCCLWPHSARAGASRHLGLEVFDQGTFKTVDASSMLARLEHGRRQHRGRSHGRHPLPPAWQRSHHPRHLPNPRPGNASLFFLAPLPLVYPLSCDLFATIKTANHFRGTFQGYLFLLPTNLSVRSMSGTLLSFVVLGAHNLSILRQAAFAALSLALASVQQPPPPSLQQL